MYIWSHENTYVILTDKEELELLKRVEPDPGSSVYYHTSKEHRKRIEKKINAFLKNWYLRDPEQFNKLFVFRTLLDDKASEMFPHFLRKYGTITKRAVFGLYSKKDRVSEMMENIVHVDDLYYVSFVKRKILPWPKYVFEDYISFPASSIEKLVGTVSNFSLILGNLTIRFRENNVTLNYFDYERDSNAQT